jgi:hypothetical protein
MIGPFLGIPLLLGTLALSVDLIEYQPVTPSRERLSDVPIRRVLPATSTGTAIPRPDMISNLDRDALAQDARMADANARGDGPAFDVTLPPEPRPPTLPSPLSNP